MKSKEALHALSLLGTNAPYKLKGRFPNQYVEYDGDRLIELPWNVYSKELVRLLNGAYFEGYLQKGRESSQ